MRAVDRRGFQAKEAIINGLLSRYPLTEEGYVAAAAALFWDSWESLTGLFVKIASFFKRITLGDHDPAIFTHWAGVRFLLDSQRSKSYERPASRVWQHVSWNDIYLTPKEKYYVMDYRPGTGLGNEELETIQAGMLELVMPVLPHRLSDDWRKVIEQMDFLDVPGMRAVRTGIEQGKRTEANSLEEQMEIVKRGKVSYLFERYTDELQIQTLFLLLRGGNLEVKAQMKYHVDKWGRARYGDKTWPHKVQDEIPALFIGMTGLDEEFRNREIYAEKILYDTPAEPVAGHAGDGAQRLRRQGQDLQQRLSHPLSRHLGHQRGAAEQRRPGEVDPRPQGLPRIRHGQGVRPLAGAPLGHLHEGRRRRAIAHRRRASAPSPAPTPSRTSSRRNSPRCRTASCSSPAAGSSIPTPTSTARSGWWRPRRSSTGSPPTKRRSITACTPCRNRCASPTARSCSFPTASRCRAGGTATPCPASCTTSSTSGPPWPCPSASRLLQHAQGGRALARSQRSQRLHPLPARLSLHGDGLQGVGRACCTPVVSLKTRDEAARRHARRNYVRIILNDYVLNPGPSQVPMALADPSEEQRGVRDAGLQPLRTDGVVRRALGQAAAAGPGLGGRRARQAPPRQRPLDPYPRTVRQQVGVRRKELGVRS